MIKILPSPIKKHSVLSQEEILELIKFNFPKLDESDILIAAGQLVEVRRDDLEKLLHPGRYITKQGKRVQAAYIRAAPVIYKLTTDENFCNWISLASKTSSLSFSCIEGFLKSSVIIISKQGLQLLERWTDLGISIAEKNSPLSIAYFNHTAGIITHPFVSANNSDIPPENASPDNTSPDISIDFEKFKALINIGEKFASSNANVAEAYFEYLSDLLALLPPENFRSFCCIIEHLISIDWTVAVDLLEGAKEVFSAITFERRGKLLTSLNEFISCIGYEAKVSRALFKNTPAAMTNLNDRDFEVWVSIAKDIAKISIDAVITFLNRSPAILASLKISELKEWSDKGIINLSSEEQLLEKFYDSSFTGLGKHVKSIGSEERRYLLAIGVELTAVNHNRIDSYFEYSPIALRLFSESKFKEWVEIGIKISKESSSFGSSYFKNSILSLEKIHLSYQGEIFKIAGMLLERDWILAGKFFENLPYVVEKIEHTEIMRWVSTGVTVYDVDRNLAVDYFTYSPRLLDDLDVMELEEWAINGLRIFENNTFLGRPYFSLRSKSSKDFIEGLDGGTALKKVAEILQYFAIGLSGSDFKIRSKKELSIPIDDIDTINPVISGRTIYLEPRIKKYRSFEDNFKIYKLSLMHEIGHSHFSSTKFSSKILGDLLNAIKETYGDKVALGISTCAEDPCVEDPCVEDPCAGDLIEISTIIAMFPNRTLAANILGILEDSRVEYLIMNLYRGVRSDLETMRYQMLLGRPVPEGDLEKLMESLLWLSTLHEPPFGLTEESRALLDKIRNILLSCIFHPGSSTLTSLEATFVIYRMFEDLLGSLRCRKYKMIKNIEYRGVGPGSLDMGRSLVTDSHEQVINRFIPEKEDSTAVVEKERAEEEKTRRKPTFEVNKNWTVLGSYRYDEWDYVINDYKPDWCVVNEIKPAGESNKYYTDACERYKKEIALIKNIFSRMRPEPFQKLKKQTDGTEIDVDAFSEALIERRCGISPEEKFYMRWDKPKRDVATLFLIDASISTRKKLAGTGRSILDIEKDALVIMTQALESIGDKYGIYAFSGHTREDVEYYIIKEFDDELSENVGQRIGLLEPVANTRLGPAIRHSVKKLRQVNARTKILVLLSDGEPYDTCYGDGAYQGRRAEEDTKIAIQEGSSSGINFFCITVDTNPGDYLDTIFSDAGYTIIDNAQILPERLPLLYKRIST